MRRDPALLLVLFALGAIGCPKEASEPAAETTRPLTGPEIPNPRADTRYVRIRNLLQEPVESKRRAFELYGLVEPVCTDESEREAFMDVAGWSARYAQKEDQLPAVLAADTIEHVATVCVRRWPEAAFDLLARAEEVLPSEPRVHVVRARLLAARGNFEPALLAAEQARVLGSVHAIALIANIQAQIARSKEPGYRPGMFEPSFATLDVEPEPSWILVDVAAILATRARLLTERSIWESGNTAKKTLLEATTVYGRLSREPFGGSPRQRALDVACFDSVELGIDAEDACRRAALEFRVLGAAVVAKVPTDALGFDNARLEGLRRAKDRLAALGPEDVLLVVARGDEAEILEWARPAAALLRAVAGQKPTIIAVDRTASNRGSALFARILELGAVSVDRRIAAPKDTFAMPCLTALLAGRQTPSTCPFEPAVEAALIKLGAKKRSVLAVLVGRDLDAELDDLDLYDLDAMLLSFRESREKKGLDAWLKSLSDVWIVAPAKK